jgi:hypothetical protein
LLFFNIELFVEDSRTVLLDSNDSKFSTPFSLTKLAVLLSVFSASFCLICSKSSKWSCSSIFVNWKLRLLWR